MHTKHRMGFLQMETTLAVLGDRRRSSILVAHECNVMKTSPYEPTINTSVGDAKHDVTSRRFGPTLVEFVVVVVLFSLFSFRFAGIPVIALAGVVFWRSRASTPRYAALILTVSAFLLPMDVRFASSAMHHGTSTTSVRVVPAFGAEMTAHTNIRRSHTEYYTSHIINRPRWIVSIDFSRL